MGAARRTAKMVDVVDLEDGESVEVATVAEIGSMRGPAVEAGVVTAVGTAALLAFGSGGYGLARRERMGVVLTDRRIILVEANQTTGRFVRTAAAAPRSRLARGPMRTKVYLSYDLLDAESAEALVKLSFPLPARSAGQQIGEALPELAERLPPAAEVQSPPPQPGGSEGAWWPDPTGQARLRYHDGTQWTEHTAD